MLRVGNSMDVQGITLRHVMTPNVESVRPDTVLEEAAKLMRTLDIGAIPVCDGDRLVGMLTDRDITVRATAEDRNPKATAVSDVMTSDVVYCFDDETVGLAAAKMTAEQVRRIPVVNRQKQLVGIVSLGDLALDMDQRVAGQILERVSEPTDPPIAPE